MPNFFRILVSVFSLWLVTAGTQADTIDLRGATAYNLFVFTSINAETTAVEGVATSAGTIQLKSSQSSRPQNPEVAAAKSDLLQLSQTLSNYATTGKTIPARKTLTLEGDCSSKLQVFTVTTSEISKASSVNLRCIPESALVVVNLTGSSFAIEKLNLASFSTLADKVLFNAPSAITIKLTSSDFHGSLLAPSARVTLTGGSFSGQLISDTFYGSATLHNIPFQKELVKSTETSAPTTNVSTSTSNLNAAPDCSKAVASPKSLWPVNHKFQKINFLGVTDPNGDPLDLRVKCIFQDEPLNSLGDGTTEWDADGIYAAAALVRAERSGTGNGRVYHIEFEASDPAGESCRGKVTVGVPHSRNGVAVDEGRLYQSVKSHFDCNGVAENHAPTITSIPSTTATVNLAYHYQVIASDLDGDSLIYTLDAAPVGMTIDPTSGAMDWLPGVEQIGSVSVEVLVKDGRGGSDTQHFTIAVADQPNRSPVITSTPATQVVENDVYTYKVVATDPDDDILTFRLVNAPANVVLDAATQELRWATTIGDAGTYPITVQVDDGSGGVAEQSFELTVTALNRPPQITSTPARVGTENLLYAYQVVATDPDNDGVSFSLEAAPAGMHIDANGGLIEWTPTFDQAGEHEVSITVSDAGGQVTEQRYSLVILNTNRNPAFTSVPVTTGVENAAYAYHAQAIDADGDRVQIGFVGTPPEGMTLNEGRVSWTPSYTQAGRYELTLMATDGVATSLQQFTLTVTNSNRAPRLQPQVVTTQEDTPLSIVLVGVDEDGDPLNYTLVTAPQHGIISGALPQLTYTPERDFSGTDTVGIVVSDEFDSSAETVLSFSIQPINDAPVARNVNASVNAGEPVNLTLLGDDVEGAALTYRIATEPRNGHLTGVAPQLTYTSEAGFSGIESFSYTVSDGEAISLPAAVNIDVAKVNRAPHISSIPTLTATENVTLSTRIEAVDPDNDSLLFALEQFPVGMSLQPSTGTLTWLPPADFVQSVAETNTQCYVAADQPVGTQEEPPQNANEFKNLADIRVGALNIEALEGEQVTLSIALQNRGLADAVGNINLEVFNGDFSLGDRIASLSVNGLNAGVENSMTFVTQRSRLTGDIYARVKTDKSIEECNVLNNKSKAALVRLRVSDPAGLQDIALFLINTLDSNDAPTITSPTEITLQLLQPNHQGVEATDNDVGDDHAFSLVSSPEGLAIDSRTGKLIASAQLLPGQYEVVVRVQDLRGGFTEQSLVLVVIQNAAPQITSLANVSVQENSPYLYDVEAVDPNDGDSLQFSLLHAPEGMSVDATTGAIHWNASDAKTYADNRSDSNVLCLADPTQQMGQIDPTLKWHWRGGTVHSEYNQVMMMPVVGQLSDDNGDGVINQYDQTDVVFSSFYLGRTATTGGGAPGYIRIVSGDTGSEILTIESEVEAFGSIALADLDGDSVAEILAPRVGGNLVVFDHKGAVKFEIQKSKEFNFQGPTVADINGDNHPEILWSGSVYTSTGTLLWSASSGFSGGFDFVGGFGVVADLDLDGDQEVIFGASIFDHVGNLLWSNPSFGDGFVGVGNFDEDANPEIVWAGNGAVRLLQHTGQTIWSRPLPGFGFGGAPTIADLDGDGLREIGVANGENYVVIKSNGELLWQSTTRDYSSGATSSTVFDLNGDNRNEILYADEFYLRIYNGSDGSVLSEIRNTSATTFEFPVVADIDNDRHADVVVVSNQYLQARRGDPFTDTTYGVRAFESASNSWMPTRAVWNQHAYNINNINDDLTVPSHPINSWQSHNTFRVNTKPVVGPIELPDLSIHALNYNDATQTVTAMVKNRGLTAITGPITVKFTQVDDAGALLSLGEQALASLNRDEERVISLAVEGARLNGRVRAEIAAPAGAVECVTNNNQIQAVVVEAQVHDSAHLFDAQKFSVAVNNVNDAPSFTSEAASSATAQQPYQFSVVVDDRDGGDAFTFELVDAPAGLQINARTGIVSSTGMSEGVYSFGIRAADLSGATAEQVHVLTVMAPDNASPVIMSTPPNVGVEGTEYQYQVSATDSDSDPIFYLLSRTQEGMTIDGVTGLIRWTPTIAQLGSRSVEVTAIDLRGASTKQYFVINVDQRNALNQPPVISSNPTGSTFAGQAFSYQVFALDPDGDALSYRLGGSTGNMKIASHGLFTWLPAAELIGQTVQVQIEVRDGKGGVAYQMLTLPVNESFNNPPVIDSVPSQLAQVGTTYQYALQANDPDGDELTYALERGPNGLSISPLGLVTWIPSVIQANKEFEVVLRVSDARDAASLQSFLVSVDALAEENFLPNISSVPTSPAFVGEQYRYDVIARDADQDALSYFLVSAPGGMTIDASGSLRWIPESVQIGAHSIVLQVNDGRSYVQQQYTLNVVQKVQGDTNQYPEFVSVPRFTGVIHEPYTYQIDAQDANEDPLRFGLLAFPEGMTISDTGLVQWTPSANQVGLHDVEVFVDDGRGRTLQTYSITVSSAPQALSVSVTASPAYASAGDVVSINVFAVGGSAAVTRTLTVDGQPVTLDIYGRAQWVASELGRHRIEARVSDGQTTQADELFVSVGDAADGVAPVVTIASPLDTTLLTTPTHIVASVVDTSAVYYQVFISEKDRNQWRLINEGSEGGVDLTLGLVDPSLLTNGQYDVAVRAEDLSGHVTTAAITVLVEGGMKVGNFSISFRDLEIPVMGIPIQVTRTYDSRRRHEPLDFGYGWSIDYQNIKLEESRVPGSQWAINRYRRGPLEAISDFCIEPLGSPLVSVTLPNGKVERFEVEASPKCNSFQIVKTVSLSFKAAAGTTSTLEALDSSTAFYNGGILLDTGTMTSAINPNRYKLTTKSGFEYVIDQNKGLEKVVHPNGSNLVYTEHGIIHSSGKSVIFKRNSAGQISSIIDPNGNELVYEYDLFGDLSHSIDTLGHRTRFTYIDRHALEEIYDPLNRKLLKNHYDDEGRLTAQEDGQGHFKYFNHDLDARSSVLTDRDGRSKVINFDDRGNVREQFDIITDASYGADIKTSYTYDANDNQTSKTVGAEAYTWTSEYDERNDLQFSQDPEGNRVEYTDYNARGQELVVRDEMGRVTVMQYDAMGNLFQIDLPSVTDPDDGTTRQLSAGNYINIRGQVESTTDLRGHTTSYTYYPTGHAWEGQKQTESNPVSGKITYTYDNNLNIKTETRERTIDGVLTTETIAHDYDARSRLVRSTYPDGSSTETRYDEAGAIDMERDRYGNWTDYTYDEYGRLLETIYPNQSRETRTYTPEGLLHTVTDRSDRTTTYVYDDAGRLWKTIFPDSTFTETRYTDQGWVKYQWDENRNLTEYVYDLAGKRKEVIRYLNERPVRHSYSYYPNGELQSETDARGHTTTYSINELDQRIETLFHDGTLVRQRYDAMGARTKSIDQNAITTVFRYDGLGRLKGVRPDVEIGNVSVPETQYEYDEVGNKLSQQDANRHLTQWTYDYHNRVLTRTLPAGQQERFVYDDSAHTLTHTDFNGQASVTAYDSMGRVASVEYSNGHREDFVYFENDQIHTVTDKHGTTEYGYDARDRMNLVIQPDGTRIDYQYDDAGNRTQVRVDRDATVTLVDYTYDDLNRLDTVTDTNGTTVYTYFDTGSLQTVTYPNGVVTTYSYNVVNQLESVTTRDASGNVISGYTYGLDDTGRRETITEANGRFTDNDYDDLYRLTSETVTDPQNGNYSATYRYDWAGNRVYSIVNGVHTEYRYNDNDQLQTQGGVSYVYDDNGNLRAETEDGVTTTYFYDEKNRLSSLEKGGVTTGYTYNHNGIRTSKSENGQTTTYVVDENRDYAQVIEEVVGDNTAAKYTYGLDLINQQREGRLSYYQFDGLGSTRALTDASGQVTDQYNYAAFGELLNSSGDTANEFRYTGERYDSSLDQYYLRARYYDPGVGRFTQQDTWQGNSQDPITLNKYLYANADPALYTDPSGNFSLGQLGVSTNIQAILTTASRVDTGLSLLDFALNGDVDELSASQIGAIVLFELAGPKLGKLLGKKAKDCFRNSFVAGTVVHTEDGLVPIEEVKIGDKVLSWNEEKNIQEFKAVTHLIQYAMERDLVELKLGERSIQCTSEHPFYIDGKWVPAKAIKSGDKVYLRDGSNKSVEVTGVAMPNLVKVYNLTVKDNQNYYVGPEGVLVHNSRPCSLSFIHDLGPDPFPASAKAQAHHIFPVQLHSTPVGQKLKSWNINLNGSDNGIWLPSRDYPGRVATIHRGSHPGYTQAVLARLDKATDRDAAIRIIGEIRSDLQNGRVILNNAK